MAVVDASVVVDWIAPDADLGSAAVGTLRQLEAEDAELLAPRLLLEEVANALLSGIRRRRWTPVAADRAYQMLSRLPVHLTDDARDLTRAWELSRRYENHPIYDMLYVALAERVGTTLITADEALRDRLMLPWVRAPGG